MEDSRSQGLYPKETVAAVLNISERRLEQLAQKKIVPKAGRGVFDLGPTVTAYIRYLQGLRSGAISEGSESELDRRFQEARVLERESKARQAKYRADLMEQSIEDSHLRHAVKMLPSRVKNALRHYDSRLVDLVVLEVEDAIAEMLGDED